jgi:hypothetical protein
MSTVPSQANDHHEVFVSTNSSTSTSSYMNAPTFHDHKVELTEQEQQETNYKPLDETAEETLKHQAYNAYSERSFGVQAFMRPSYFSNRSVHPHPYRQSSQRHFHTSQQQSIKDPRRWNNSKRRSTMKIMGLGGGVSPHSIPSPGPTDDNGHTKQHNHHDQFLDRVGGFELDDSQSLGQTSGDGCEDQSDAVDSFFSSIRVPASFIVGASFSELFGNYNKDGEVDTNMQIILQTVCVVFQGFAFALSLSVIVLSSSALVRGLTANFDPYAENGYELLFREFHFEFVCVRWAYNMSMFGFLLAVGAKILFEFELFNYEGENWTRGHLEVGIAVVLILFSLAMHLAAYLNSTLIGWENMTDMTLDMIRMIICRGKVHTMEALSLAILAVGLFFLILGLIPGSQI